MHPEQFEEKIQLPKADRRVLPPPTLEAALRLAEETVA
jgi:hypothetical protein